MKFFPLLFLTITVSAIWWEYLVTKRILSDYFFSPSYSISPKIHKCWACAFNLYMYAEHTLTNCMRYSAFVNQVHEYAEHSCTKKTHINYMEHTLLLSKCLQINEIIIVCAAFAYEVNLYAQHLVWGVCVCSACVYQPQNTLSIIFHVLSEKFLENAKVSKNAFDFYKWVYV